jgi:hypothetical protein
MKHLPVVLLLPAAFALSACSDLSTSAADPPDNPIEQVFGLQRPAQDMKTLDAAFAEIAGGIPGFGGLFFDERGVANVYMTGTAPLDAGALATQLNARLRQVGLSGTISAQELVVRAGAYDFAELSRYHRNVMPVLGAPGVVFTDADETLNRIVIGVEEGTAEEVIMDAIRQLGVPEDAVTVVTADPIVPVQSLNDHISASASASTIGGLPTLRDEHRPIAAGVQIWRFTPPSSASICTLGFTATAPTFSQGRLMFTNHHCTEVRGQVTGTLWNQKPLAFPLDYVAQEIEDPPFFTNAQNSACPVGRVCRYADAAAGVYTVPNEQVMTARVMAPFPGTLVLPATGRTFRIVEEATARPIVGQGLMKVGRTTGLTGAAVIATCQNANTAPNITYLCQERVAIDVVGGDSGSPVIEPLDNRAFMDVTPNQRVRLHGLLWGGSNNTYVYSSMLNIRMDFPGPWIVTER